MNAQDNKSEAEIVIKDQIYKYIDMNFSTLNAGAVTALHLSDHVSLLCDIDLLNLSLAKGHAGSRSCH